MQFKSQTVFIILICKIAFATTVFAQEGILIDRAPFALPTYAQATESTDVEFYADQSRYDAARNDNNYIFEKINYRSDGLEVTAYLMRARNGETKPTVIFNRGSYIRNNAAPEILPLMYNMARRGFTVLAPMYRGSEGTDGRDELGGADLNDLLAMATLVKELPSADENRLYLYGESRGGMMVYQALRDGFPARAAAVYGAFADLGGLIESDPEQYSGMVQFLWPDFDQHQDEIIARRSAIQFTDQLKTPLLIMHGGLDGDVPVRQSMALAAKLSDQDAKFDLVVFGDDTHILPNHFNERDARASRWFREH